jgi:N-acyl-D-amino-acid deacylase
MNYDLVIKNGLLIDGSGAPRVRGDVAVVGDRIVALGDDVDGGGREEIDADGLVVAPGFVDGHTHMDAQVFWDHLGSSSCWQGITTVVMGNCGYTLAPAQPEHRGFLKSHVERAEDIPEEAMAKGIDWTWTTFAEYFDALDALPKGINYAGSIGHSALRVWAMGERAFEEAASGDDLAIMERELSDALRAGAVGFTTTRNPNHTTSQNRPVASRQASWDELEALVGLMAREGTGVFQAGGVGHSPADVDRTQQLALSTGVMTLTNTLGFVDETVAKGGNMLGLTHCRGFCVMQSFRTRVSFDTIPGSEWQSVRSRPLEEQRALLQDPEVRARLVHEAHHGEYRPEASADPFKPDYEMIYVMRSAYLPNPSVAAEARRLGKDPVEVMIDAALETNFDIFFVQTFGNDVGGKAFHEQQPMDELVALLRNPNMAMTFSDAGAHLSQVADNDLTTHLLSYWVRERQALTLEEAIPAITRQPARAWRLHDRGMLAPGYAADITIFDPDTVAPELPRVVHDLPGGFPRIEQRAVGYAATIVNGEVFTRNGEATDVRPGRLLRAGQIAVPAT